MAVMMGSEGVGNCGGVIWCLWIQCDMVVQMKSVRMVGVCCHWKCSLRTLNASFLAFSCSAPGHHRTGWCLPTADHIQSIIHHVDCQKFGVVWLWVVNHSYILTTECGSQLVISE